MSTVNVYRHEGRKFAYCIGEVQSKPGFTQLMHAAADTFLLLYLEKLGIRKLEAFFAVMIGVMTISFGVMYVQSGAPTGEVILGVVLPRVEYALLSQK